MADPTPSTARRIVLTTFGSLGDLHPYLALGLGLKARGHRPLIATSERYREKICGLGLGFAPVRPDIPDVLADPDLIRRLMDLRKGSENVVCELVMPALRDSYADLTAATQGADLLISHPLTYAARLVAEKRGVRWASAMLQPIGFFSAYDPPVIPQAAWLSKLRFLGPWFFRRLFALAERSVRPWGAPWHRLRTELGLPPSGDNPVFAGQHAPALVLALFSRQLASPQPDWPAQCRITGFPFHDDDGALAPELERFLAEGSPPLVFTLGSSAVMDAGAFYEHSAAAAAALGRRALLLIGRDPRNRPANLPTGVIAAEYAPYAQVFPRAVAIVHQGGVGTTGQAMRAGRPMLVMPYAHDQPDHAARMVRRGIGLALGRDRYTAARAAATLARLLGDPGFAQRAKTVGEAVRLEDGIGTACTEIENLLAAR